MAAPLVPVFVAGDLYGNILGEIPFDQGTFKSSLSTSGAFSATVAAAELGVNIYTMTNPGINTVYVLYDQIPVGGWIIWGRQYESESKKLTLTGNDFWSYMSRRLIRTNFTLTNVDQMTAALNLLLETQSGGSPPPPLVTLAIGPPSGILITDSHPATELKGLGDLFATYASAEPGFEYRQTLGWTGTQIENVLNVGYPHLGVSAAATQFAFDLYADPKHPSSTGNILRYQETEDASKLMSAVFAIGQGTGTTQVVGGFTAPQGSYPLTEGTVSYKDIKTVSVLDGLAQSVASLFNAAPVSFQIQMRLESSPFYGEYLPGDCCRLIIQDERFPVLSGQGLNTAARITDVELHWDTTQPPTVMVYTGGAVF